MSDYENYIDLDLFNALLDGKYNNKLSMNIEQFNYFLNAISQKSGLIILTGVTFSGMNTHIYTALLVLAKKGKKISTIEIAQRCDLPGIDQTTVGGFDQMAGELDRIVSTDADVIYMREIALWNDADAVLSAAESGKLIIATMHAHDVVSVFNRFLCFPVNPDGQDILSRILDSLLLVQAQRKLPQLCNNCKASMGVEENLLSLLGMCQGECSAKFYNPRVCEHCADEQFAGYKGYAYIYESLLIDDINRKRIMFYFDVDKSEAWKKPPFNYAADQLLMDSAKERAVQGRISIGDCFRGSAAGGIHLDDYPAGFLEFMLHIPMNDLSAKVFSTNIHELTNYPRIVIESYMDADNLELKEIIIAKDGYFIINTSTRDKDDSSDVVFKTCRGRIDSYYSEAWFKLHDDSFEVVSFEEESNKKLCIESRNYYYDFASDVTGEVSLPNIEVEDICYFPEASIIFESDSRSFHMPKDNETKLALQEFGTKILKEFEEVADSNILSCAEEVLSSGIYSIWTSSYLRAVKRVRELSLKTFNSTYDSAEGYYC